MDQSTAADLVNRAFREVRSNDSSLLRNNAHERSIVHKFACYLQQKFAEHEFDEQVDYDDVVVDCEYNQEGHGDTKTLPEIEGESEEDQIYPDVIVHKRGTHSQNLLVIEAKKESSNDNRESDRERLRILTNDKEYNKRYDYDQGLFLIIPVNENWENEPDTDWYPKD